MNRRTFLKALAAAQAAALLRPRDADASLPKAKITRVRIYRPPNLNPLFNQSNMVVTVETDVGITGIGEGGAKDDVLKRGLAQQRAIGALVAAGDLRQARWTRGLFCWPLSAFRPA